MPDAGSPSIQPKALKLTGVKVITKQLADGRVKFYYRHRESNRMLGSSDDNDAVTLEYNRMNGNDIKVAEKDMAKPQHDTVCALIGRFYEDDMFTSVTASTRKAYRLALERLRGVYRLGDPKEGDRRPFWGDQDPTEINRMHVRFLRREMRDTPAASNRAIMVYHRLFKYATFERPYENLANPFSEAGRYQEEPRTTIWTDDELRAFLQSSRTRKLGGNPTLCERYRVPLPERIEYLPWRMYYAAAISYYTAMRRIDMLGLQFSNIKEDEDGQPYLSFTPQKTERKTGLQLDFRIPATLWKLLQAHPGCGDQKAYIVPAPSNPYLRWQENNFSGKFRTWITAADLDEADVRYHDLRRTGIVQLGKLNLQPQIIAAISGHSIAYCVNILGVYLPKLKALADVGIKAIDEAEANRRKSGEVLAFDVPAQLPPPRVAA